MFKRILLAALAALAALTALAGPALGGQTERLAVVAAPSEGASSVHTPATRRRTRTTAAWLFAHRADLLAALVYGCLAFLSFSVTEYAL